MKSELALCFTFSTIAARRYESGEQESAKKSMANAEKAYETVIHFLSDRKHSTHLTAEESQDITIELERLRDRLDGLIQRFKK
jgi:regulator of replication initiation timing